MRGRTIAAGLAGASLLCAAAGTVAWRGGPAPSVVSEPVVRGDLEATISAFGRLHPRDYVDVGAQASGEILRIHVDEGDRVTAGALLAEIDPTTQQAQVEAARAEVVRLEAQLRELEARARQAAARAGRAASLLDRAVASIDAHDEAQTEAEAAAARVAVTAAEIRGARAELATAEAELARTRIHAPMAGTVVSIDARQGQTVVATYETPPLLRIADLSVMTLRAQVAEADVARLLPGMPAWFTTLAHPESRRETRLRQLLPAPEGDAADAAKSDAVVLYTALLDVANPDGALLAGMSATVFLVTARAEDALLVPVAALGEGAGPGEADRAVVRVLGPAGAPETREIRLGLRTRFQAEAVEGLAEGEQVVTGETAPEGRSLLRFAL